MHIYTNMHTQKHRYIHIHTHTHISSHVAMEPHVPRYMRRMTGRRKWEQTGLPKATSAPCFPIRSESSGRIWVSLQVSLRASHPASGSPAERSRKKVMSNGVCGGEHQAAVGSGHWCAFPVWPPRTSLGQSADPGAAPGEGDAPWLWVGDGPFSDPQFVLGAPTGCSTATSPIGRYTNSACGRGIPMATRPPLPRARTWGARDMVTCQEPRRRCRQPPGSRPGVGSPSGAQQDPEAWP